jgi:hypothetical protein
MILQKFNLELCDKSLASGELEFSPNSVILAATKNIMLKPTLRY